MRKGDIKRQAILDVAERLFYQKGYEQTSVQDVLSVLKCSKGSFYHHFESKMSVLETLCVQRAQKALAGYQKAVKDAALPLDRLNLLLYYAMPVRKAEQQFISLLLPMAAAPEGAVLCQRYEEAITDTFSSTLDDILLSGTLDSTFFIPRLDGMSRIVLALLNHFWREIAQMLAACRAMGALDPNALLPLAELYRYAVQHLIEAPYGSIEIVRLTELYPLLEAVLMRMRLEP